MSRFSDSLDPKLLSDIVCICCWKIIDANAHTLLARLDERDATVDGDLIEVRFLTRDPLTVNGMGVWANVGAGRLLLVSAGSRIYKLLAKLTFTLLSVRDDDSAISCNKCNKSVGIRPSSGGVRLTEISARFISCDCRGMLRDYRVLVGSCPVCLADQVELTKFKTCPHATCHDCFRRLDKCPECREPLQTGASAVLRSIVGPPDAKWKLGYNVGTSAHERLLAIMDLSQQFQTLLAATIRQYQPAT